VSKSESCLLANPEVEDRMIRKAPPRGGDCGESNGSGQVIPPGAESERLSLTRLR